MHELFINVLYASWDGTTPGANSFLSEIRIYVDHEIYLKVSDKIGTLVPEKYTIFSSLANDKRSFFAQFLSKFWIRPLKTAFFKNFAPTAMWKSTKHRRDSYIYNGRKLVIFPKSKTWQIGLSPAWLFEDFLKAIWNWASNFTEYSFVTRPSFYDTSIFYNILSRPGILSGVLILIKLRKIQFYWLRKSNCQRILRDRSGKWWRMAFIHNAKL